MTTGLGASQRPSKTARTRRSRNRFKRERLRIQRRLLAGGFLTDGRRLACDPGEWGHAFASHPGFDTLRSDWRATVGFVARAMATLAHHEACVVRASREALAARATELAQRPITVHQVKRAVRLLRNTTMLSTLEKGQRASARHPRPSVPLYALTVPVAADEALPARTPGGKGRTVQTRIAEHDRQVRKALGIEEPVDATAPQNRGSHHGGTATPFIPHQGRRRRPAEHHSRPVTPPRPRRGEISAAAQARYAARLLAAEVPKTMAMGLLRLGQIAKLVAPFAAAGWSGADVDFALQHGPDGTPHRWSARVRHPLAWARWRLSLWISDSGAPLPSRWEQLGGHVTASRGPLGQAVPAQRAQVILSGCHEDVPTPVPGAEETWETEQLLGVPVGDEPNDAYLAARATHRAERSIAASKRTPTQTVLAPAVIQEPEDLTLAAVLRLCALEAATPADVRAEYRSRARASMSCAPFRR